MAKTAIIVGAGVGGIATAARLAYAGFDVEVYEKNEFSGGRCSLIHHKEYRFDQGPSLLLLPRLFRQLFTDLGTNLEEHVQLVQCEPNYVLHYHDGEKVTLSSDRAQLAREVEKWEGEGGAERLEAFLREAGVHGQLSYDHVLARTFPSLLSFLRPAVLFNLIRLHPFATVYGRCARYFKTERIRRAFSFGSMYLGSSPFEAPGTYTLLEWTETCEGIWYPIGGFHAVLQAIIDISEKLPNPVKYHYSTPVARVLHTNGKATGIRLENGEEKKADVVVVNADLAWAHNNLFDVEGGTDRVKREGRKIKARVHAKQEVAPSLTPLNASLAKRLLDKPHSCSSISFYWAMNSKISSLNMHNIFLAEDYKSSFDDIFKRHTMPTEPSFYVNVPSRVDSSAAPRDKDTIVVLVPVGHLLPSPTTSPKLFSSPSSSSSSGSSKMPNHPEQDWDVIVNRAREQIVSVMEARLGIKDLRGLIAWEGINTPLTWRDKFNLTHGSILGISHSFFNVLSFRHQAPHPSLKNTYFVGASAHPGTGVPIAIAGSRLCAQTIFKDQGVPVPSTWNGDTRDREEVSVSGSDLDTKRGKRIVHVLEDTIGTVWPYFVGATVAIIILTLTLLAGSLYLRLCRPEDVDGLVRWVYERVAGSPTPGPLDPMTASQFLLTPPHELPNNDVLSGEKMKGPILWGSVIALFLSIAYINLPGSQTLPRQTV